MLHVSKETPDSVLWLGAPAPSPALSAHLEAQGFVLARSFSEDTPAGLPVRRLTAFDPFIGGTPGRITLGGRRIALIQADPASADVLAQALRAKGADVIVLSFTFDSFERAEHLDPDIVLIEPSYFCGEGWQLMNAVWQHPRLRWATVLLASPDAYGFKGPLVTDMRPLCAVIQRLCVDADQLRALSRAGEPFEVDLHTLGPARMLRLLVSTSRALRAEFTGPLATITVDTAKELIVGARAELHAGGPKLYGPSALAMCLSLERGQVSVRGVQHASVANVMAPLDVALHAAAQALVAESAGDTPTRPALFEDTPTRQWEEGPFSTITGELTTVRGDVPTRRITPEPLAEQSTEVFTHVDPHSSPLGSLPRPVIGSVPFRAHGYGFSGLLRTGAILASLLLLSWIALRANDVAAPEVGRLAHARMVEHPASATLPKEPRVRAAAAAPPHVASPTPMPEAPSPQKPGAASDNEAGDRQVVSALDDEGGDAGLDLDESLDEGNRSPGRMRAQRASELARMGHLLRARGAYTEARGKYLAALEAYSGYPRALAGLAQLALLRGDGAEAAKYAEQLVTERPGQAVYHLILGDAYRAAGQLVKARAAWRVASELGSPKAKSRLSGKRAGKEP